jgi:hypothetical protein
VTSQLDLVCRQQLGQFVIVGNLLLVKLHLVSPVQRTDVLPNLFRNSLPIVGGCVINVPTCLHQILFTLAQKASVVEELLGDAAHVDASTSEAPFGTGR